MRGTGRPTQLPGWMRVAIRTLGAFMANGASLSGVVAVGSGIFLWRHGDRSCSLVPRRRKVLVRRTGRPTQLPGRVRVDITTLDALMGFEHHLGGVMALRGGPRS